MDRILPALLVALLALVFPTLVLPADPTYEKCTCDLRDPRLANGASVRNATACWSHENINDQWCDISVQAIESDGRLQTILNELHFLQSSPEALTSYLLEQAENASETFDDEWAAFMEEHEPQFADLFFDHSELIAICVERFFRQRETSQAYEPFQEGPFTCRVGAITGWLRMSFAVGDSRFVYMIAPDA